MAVYPPLAAEGLNYSSPYRCIVCAFSRARSGQKRTERILCYETLRYSQREARPGVVRPAQAREAPSKGARDGRRKKRLHVVEAARGCRLACGVMKRQKIVPASLRRAG